MRSNRTVPARRTFAVRHQPAAGELRDSLDIVPQRCLPLASVLLLQLVVVAGIIAARLLGLQGWYGAGFGAATGAVLLIRLRGKALPQWAALWLDYRWRRRHRSRAVTVTEPFDVEASDGSQVGFRWDGKTLLSVLQIDENPQAITVMEPGVTVCGETLPIQLIARCLRQFDIGLDSIDVISHGARSHGHTPVAAAYDAVLGPLPAIAQRSVWVVLRFDPCQCAEAVRRRGGGREAIAATAVTATRRVANRLIAAGLRPRVMTAGGIVHAARQLSDGVNVHNVEETWLTCKQGFFQLHSFRIQPAMLTTAGVGLLWSIPSYSTTVCISLRQDHRRDVVQIRGLARFDTQGRSEIYLPGLEELPGQQFSALVATLPLPPAKRSVTRWAFATDETALELAVPASGCGQVIGADSQGRAVALPLFGPQIQRVEICGGLHLAQQVLVRSLALGARARIHTNRPAAWQEMVDRVGDRRLLSVADAGRASIGPDRDRNCSVQLFDGVAAHSAQAGVTMMVLGAANTASASCDVALELLDGTADTVKVSTSAASAVVRMVATDEELRYIKSSLDVAG